MIADDPDGATALDLDDMAGLKFRHVTTRAELDELEQANITQGLQWLSRWRGRDVLREDFLRTLHQKLFGEVWTWAGKYRLREKNIGVAPFQIAVQLHQLVENTRHWVKHNVYTPSEVIGRFHHRLVQIHPFPNGNGRHGRIAADALSKTHFSLPPIDWAKGMDLHSGSTRRRDYIEAPQAADKGDFALLLAFVAA